MKLRQLIIILSFISYTAGFLLGLSTEKDSIDCDVSPSSTQEFQEILSTREESQFTSFIFIARNNLVVVLRNLIPSAYKVMFKLNSVVATLIPLLICLFVFITSKFVMCDFFEKKLHLPSYFCAICFSLIPFLLYEYFFWFNLISYAGNATLSAPEDFLNMKYAFGLTLEDFNIINTCCWGYIYLHLTIYLIQKKYPLHIASLTTLFPPALVYCFLKFIC